MQLDVNHQRITVDVPLRGADHKSCHDSLLDEPKRN